MTEIIVGYARDYTRLDQRRDVKDTFVVIDGQTCMVLNISLRSFLCSGYKGSAKVDDEITIEEFLMADDSRVRLQAKGKVIRLDAESKQMVAKFVDISPRTFDILEKMMMLRPLAGKKGRLS